MHEQVSSDISLATPEADIDRVKLLNTQNIVRTALEDLEAQLRSPELASPAVALLTTNEQIPDRQLHLVDARDDAEQPHFKIYAKLTNWVDARAAVPAGMYEDSPFRFDGMPHDTLVGGGTGFTARRTQIGNAQVAFIHSDAIRTTDGMVELTVPADSADLAADIDSTLQVLTGDGLWGDQRSADSQRSWKVNAYRTYHKLPEGPLTTEQAAEADQLHIERVTPDHIALIKPGQHESYHLDYAPEQAIVPTHEFMRLGTALDTIRTGVLLSSLGRLERGNSTTGRSSGADMLYGGGNVVFTHARAANHTLFMASATMRLKPTVLDRMDVRAYSTDAYGSTETPTPSVIDQAMGHPQRTSRTAIVDGFQDRLAPEDFHTLGGVHELCIEGGVDVSECQELLLGDKAENSYEDFDWHKQLKGFAAPDAYGGVTWARDKVANAWGDEAAVQEILAGFGLPQERIEYLTVGMNLPAVERAIAKLAHVGVTEINGRPASEFIKLAPAYERPQQKP